MVFYDVKDRESFLLFIDEVEAWLKVRNAFILRLSEKDLISDEQKLLLRAEICGQVMGSNDFLCLMHFPEIREHFCSDTEWEEIERRLTSAAGLKSTNVRMLFAHTHIRDPRFDPIRADGCFYRFINRFEDLDDLWNDENPVGKTFQLSILMEKGDEWVKIPYELPVDSAENTIDEKDGLRRLKVEGVGRFPGYDGEVILDVKKADGKFYSGAYQKLYMVFSDEPEITECKEWINIEAEDFTEEEQGKPSEYYRGRCVSSVWVTNNENRWTDKKTLELMSRVLREQGTDDKDDREFWKDVYSYFFIGEKGSSWLRGGTFDVGAKEDFELSFENAVVNSGPAKIHMKVGYKCLIARNVEQAIWHFEKAASKGNVKAMELLGRLFDEPFLAEKGSMSDKERSEIAFGWHKKAAELGCVEAQVCVGVAYYMGGVFATQDYEEAMKWLRMAAEKGNAKAQFYIGKMIREGKGAQCDIEEAVHWLRLSASQGFAEAQSLLGILFCVGKEVEQDIDEGLKWISEAADMCDCHMQLILGELYYYGKYEVQDYEKAAMWFERAAERENASYYGFMAYDDLKKDRNAACEWYRLMGRALPEAQCRLGLMYQEGLGVTKDENKAQELLETAKKSGFTKENIDSSVKNAMLRLIDEPGCVPSETDDLNTSFIANEEPGKNLVEAAFRQIAEGDFEAATRLIESAVKEGNLQACVLLAELYEGCYSQPNRMGSEYERLMHMLAFNWLEKAADEG